MEEKPNGQQQKNRIWEKWFFKVDTEKKGTNKGKNLNFQGTTNNNNKNNNKTEFIKQGIPI